MSRHFSAPRRQFIAGSGAVLALTSVAGWQAALARDAAAAPRILVLYRATQPQSAAFAALAQAAGIAVLALADDPVRQWRDGLGARVAEQGLRLAGLCNWLDYGMLRGLCAEARRLPLVTLQHAAQDLQHDNLQALAGDLLDVAGSAAGVPIRQYDTQHEGRHGRRHERLLHNPLHHHPQPVLFSWVI